MNYATAHHMKAETAPSREHQLQQKKPNFDPKKA
jgi:hypothetical protein